jgi:hypothetical protein
LISVVKFLRIIYKDKFVMNLRYSDKFTTEIKGQLV